MFTHETPRIVACAKTIFFGIVIFQLKNLQFFTLLVYNLQGVS